MRLCFFGLCLAALCLTAQTRGVTDAEVQRVHRGALLIDTHNDVPWRVVDGFDIGSKSGEWHTDLTRLKAGGLGAVFFVAYVSSDYVDGNRSAHRTLQLIDTIRQGIVGKYRGDCSLDI